MKETLNILMLLDGEKGKKNVHAYPNGIRTEGPPTTNSPLPLAEIHADETL